MTNTRTLTQLVVVLLVLAAAGCAATPEDRWYQQRESLNTANRVYLVHVPTLNDEQIVYYGELLRTARTHLDAAKAQLPEGGSSFDATLDLIESILVRVAVLDAGDAPLQPTTP